MSKINKYNEFLNNEELIINQMIEVGVYREDKKIGLHSVIFYSGMCYFQFYHNDLKNGPFIVINSRFKDNKSIVEQIGYYVNDKPAEEWLLFKEYSSPKIIDYDRVYFDSDGVQRSLPSFELIFQSIMRKIK